MSDIPPPPGSWPPHGQPAGQPGAPYGQPPKGNGRTIMWVVLGIVVAILLICGGSAIALVVFGGEAVRDAVNEAKSELTATDDVEAPSVGECIYFSRDGLNDDHAEVPCGDPMASHQVVGDDGDCGTNETTYVITLGNDETIADLCLVLDAHEGDCFDIEDESKVVCADHRGETSTVEVASIGKAGTSCRGDAQPLEYADRDLVLCLVPND